MKKTILILSLIITTFFISGCNQTSPSNDMSSGVPNINAFQSKYENFTKYQLSGTSEDVFSKTITENKIDKDYDNEYYNQATTTQDQIDVQQKYINIWKQEMISSIENLKTQLSGEESINFDSVQEQWETSALDELKYEWDVLQNPNHDVFLGTAFHSSWLNEVRESYRQRTFQIKYLLYLLETQTNNPKDVGDCLSLQFNY